MLHPSDLQLSQAEKATNFETMRHIERVRNLLNRFATELLKRGELHDQSKLQPPEVGAFTEHTHKLAATTYGTKEYEEGKKLLGDALKHHYANNRHHTEYWANGINDMNLVDLIEMLCDFKAASERHNDGNINMSIEKNAIRFNMSKQLQTIFENTIDLLV